MPLSRLMQKRLHDIVKAQPPCGGSLARWRADQWLVTVAGRERLRISVEVQLERGYTMHVLYWDTMDYIDDAGRVPINLFCVALVMRGLLVGYLDRTIPSLRLIGRVSYKYGYEFMQSMFCVFIIWMFATVLFHLKERSNAEHLPVVRGDHPRVK